VSVYFQDEHVTLYHGDCLTETAWLDADVLVTDPPYGMAFRSNMGGAFGASEIVGDGDTAVRDQALTLWGADRPALCFGRWSVSRPEGTRMVLTWEKGNHVGMGDLTLPWKPNTEEIYVLGEGFTGHRGSSVLRHLAIAGTVGRAIDGTRSHPTQKPLGLLADLIAKCPPGVIADPFAGSGSTLVAAKQAGRRAIGVELEERYCEVAAKRLSQGVFDFAEATP
jgi:site-specific DNA-methyltransferase (adenine-specific)